MTKAQIITKALGLSMIATATRSKEDELAFWAFCQENDLSNDQLQNLDGAGFYISLAIMTNPKTKSVYEDMQKLYRKLRKQENKKIDQMLAAFNAQA